MSTPRRKFQEMLDHPSVIHALQIYRHHYQGDGLVTRKPVNESAVGASEITTERASEKAGNRDMAGLDRLDTKEDVALQHKRDGRVVEYGDFKVCSNCKKRLRAVAFSPQRRNGKIYLRSWCRVCEAQYAYDQYHGLNKRAP